MFNLVHAIRTFRGDGPPTTNDPHIQRLMNKDIWDERNGAALGRSIMACVSLAGWLAAFAVWWF